MPVPKDKLKAYGIIVASLQKQGKSLEQAKRISDQKLKIKHK